jgi:hypothetical protein
VRVRAVVAACCGALLLAGCNDGSARVEPAAETETEAASEPAGSASASESPTDGATPTQPADPEHVVELPGPLTDRLYRPDMLIFDSQELSDDMVRRIGELDNVAAVERIGIGQVTVENQALTIAAVDGGGYRRFTPSNTAELQEAWDRVAGGELAVRPGLGRKLQDEDGNIVLGNGEEAPVVHVGAYAPQATTIDMVVNQAWVADLENMVFGNGLLISTDEADPSTIRPAVRRIVGKRASVQDLDIASRLGLDPNVKQTAYLTGGSIASVVGSFTYQVLGGGRIAPDPAWVARSIATEAVPILGNVTCNRAMLPQLRAALQEVVDRGLAGEINPGEYAGCYYPRFIAGSTKLSNHSFGLALDMNVPGNGRGTVGEMDREVVSIFKKWGFAWGGDWSYTDPMHFELAQVVDPR